MEVGVGGGVNFPYFKEAGVKEVPWLLVRELVSFIMQYVYIFRCQLKQT